jgi:hypothetical protein
VQVVQQALDHLDPRSMQVDDDVRDRHLRHERDRRSLGGVRRAMILVSS